MDDWGRTRQAWGFLEFLETLAVCSCHFLPMNSYVGWVGWPVSLRKSLPDGLRDGSAQSVR